MSHTKLPALSKQDIHDEAHGKGRVQGILRLHHKEFHDLYDDLIIPETRLVFILYSSFIHLTEL